MYDNLYTERSLHIIVGFLIQKIYSLMSSPSLSKTKIDFQNEIT